MNNCVHELTRLHKRKLYTIAVNDHHNCLFDFMYIKSIYRLGIH